MQKKLFLGAAILGLTVLLAVAASAAPPGQAVFIAGQSTCYVDGRPVEMDVEPFTESGRVYVPVRFLAPALGVPGGGVVWSPSSRTVTLEKDGDTVTVAVGDKTMYKNGAPLEMDVAPMLRDSRTFIPARFLAEAFGCEVGWDEMNQAVLIGPPGRLPEAPGRKGEGADDVAAGELPVVGSYDKFKELLAEVRDRGGLIRALPAAGATAGAAQKELLLNDSADPAQSAKAENYSATNVQVEGVDEADIVKTDGEYIYQVNNQRVIIAKAYPASDLNVIARLDFTGKNMVPRELYVDDRYLVVIGAVSGPDPIPIYKEERVIAPEISPPCFPRNTVKAVIYDLTDKSAIKYLREVEVEGDYISSRKIGPALYLAANKYVHYNIMEREADGLNPHYRDTAVKDDFTKIEFSDIRYFPGFVEPNYLLIAGVNLDKPEEGVKVNTYLGSGENVYASRQNLYVAVTGDRPVHIMTEKIWPGPACDPATRVYKFALDEGKVTYKKKGEVPGRILNQFSMDEYGGCFRIATTAGEIWRTGESTSKNNVYVLDEDLNVVGKIENIAPGEKIYSVRFAGERGYVVTFKTVDPLFVLDLKDPRHPEILGALKIPGYSDYLHPYDENHIIGFGKDTVELGQKDAEGRPAGAMAFYTGMKMAIFDVTDVQNPVELFAERIGGRGTDSEILHNHKALLFDRDKGLLAFPVTVMETKDTVPEGSTIPAYGKFTFQGAYVYHVDLKDGFVLRGKISHLTRDDYLKAGEYWYDSDKNIERILYLDDVLYTLSRQFIKANALDGLEEINSLTIH
ncbi:MAG: beta-propeller domain-containing protein [Firmicutes bacterium]|nr:beta-propeller domain-containing protein [Bacillota bacterium]